jgi:hypothetical protein
VALVGEAGVGGGLGERAAVLDGGAGDGEAAHGAVAVGLVPRARRKWRARVKRSVPVIASRVEAGVCSLAWAAR